MAWILSRQSKCLTRWLRQSGQVALATPDRRLRRTVIFNVRAAFDDQFIMDMFDNVAVLECFHGIAQDIAANGLDDVLHKFRTVGFDAFPFFVEPTPS